MSDPRFRPSQPEIQDPDKIFDGCDGAYDDRGVFFEADVDSEGNFTIMVTGTGPDFKRAGPFLVSNLKCQGTPNISLDIKSQTMTVQCGLIQGGKLRRHFLFKEFPDPSNRTYYIGNTLRRILSAELGLTDDLGITLIEYEALIRLHKTNYVREDMVDSERYGSFIEGHIQRLKSIGVKMIEFTHKDYDYPAAWQAAFGDFRKNVRFLKQFRDELTIVCEGNNEFVNDYEDPNKSIVDENTEIIEFIKGEGMISSAGAWGNSRHGRDLSLEFLSRCKPDRIIIHRPYGSGQPMQVLIDWIRDMKEFGCKLSHNELLPDYMINSGIAVGEIPNYVSAMISEGVDAINVYGNEYELMGILCDEVNE